MAMSWRAGLACAALLLRGAEVNGDGHCAEVEIDIYEPDAAVVCHSSSVPTSRGACTGESLQWTHISPAHGGYSGCVSDVGLNPCEQDGYDVMGDFAYKRLYDFNAASGTCEPTGYDLSNKTLWILWGYPMDTTELIARTGVSPQVTFPLLRMTYPSYKWSDHGDDAADLKVRFKEFMVYQGAFNTTELEDFDVEVTEGAESGIVALYAAMALHIARTTCNRNIYALVEAPAYGYDNAQAAQWANSEADSFFNGSSCACHDATASTCREPTVTITTKGWVPGEDYPNATGADGNVYFANSSDPNSPWFETMVFPENPTGVRKTPKLDASRRVCDGVYLHPMYFGGDDWAIPATRPDCSSWSFSVTKFYSAAIRTGAVMYKNTDPAWATAVLDIMQKVHGMANGLYSEWSWMGQIQIYDMLMAKPYTDPTSWMGAYSELIKDKWDQMIDGFQNCPVVEITNPYEGAYVWFKYLGEYRGLQDSWITSFFQECLGVRTTTYNWGWRGANPAAYHGAGYGVNDFTRLQLYRDLSVYQEVNRRAKIVCAGGSFGPYMTIAEWNHSASTMNQSASRRLATGVESHEEDVAEAAPRLDRAAVKHLATLRHEASIINENVEKHCREGGYTTSCLFKYAGRTGDDVPFHTE